MTPRLVPTLRPVLFLALVLALVPLVAVACAQDDDPVVRAEGSTTTTTDEGEVTTTTASEGPAEAPVTVADVVAAFEDEGYDVTLLEMEAPSARPDDAEEHQLLEVDGGGLAFEVQVEIWTFADEDAAEAGAEDVRDEATEPDADGGSFVSENGTVVALFGCTCEADSELSGVFGDLDFSTGADPADPTTSSTDPRVIPDEPVDPGDDERLEAVLDELEAAGATVLEISDAVDDDLGADVAATVEVEVDGEEEQVEIHVFDDADLAAEVAMEVEDDAEESCGGACDQILPVAVAVGEVVFIADDGAAVLDVIEDVELP